MNRFASSTPLRLAIMIALLCLSACGDDPDSTPGDITPPTRRGVIQVGQGSGLEPIGLMDVAPDGTIFAGQSRGGMRRFDADGANVQVLPIHLSAWGDRFAVSRDRIYALNPFAKRIAVFDWLGVPLHDFSFEASELFDDFPEFDLAVTPDNILYLLDPRVRRVQKLTSTGDVLAVWGSRGIGPGEMEYPGNIEVDSQGRVVILDLDLWRVQRYSGTGQLDRTWDLVRTIEYGSFLRGDLAVDAHDQPLVLETPTEPSRVVTLEANGVGAMTWFVPPE
ncbi:MAG: PA14 domain-containing protein, partial [bacterium]